MTENSENPVIAPASVRSAASRSAKPKKGPVAPASRALAAGLSVAATCAIIATFALSVPAQDSATQVVLDVSSSGVVGDAATLPDGSPATAPMTSAEIPVGTVPGSSVPGGASPSSTASTSSGTTKSGGTATATNPVSATPVTAAPAAATPAPAPAPVTAAPTTQAPRPTTPPTTARTRAS